MDHDQLFKELLRVCFADFIKLFLPEVYAYLDTGSLEFIEQESAGTTTAHEKRSVDMLVKARFKGRLTYFLIHVEVQASKQGWSSRRMFTYFAAQEHKHDLPVYPIALLTWERPLKPDAGCYVVDFPNRRVLEFRYDVIQLNRLDWRAYLHTDNPAAIALMTKMGVAPADRPKVRAACLRLLTRQRLSPKQREPIERFIDAYTELTDAQQVEFDRELKKFKPQERKDAMEYMTSWERKGFVEGKAEGKAEGKLELTIKLLLKRLGELSRAVEKRLGKLSPEQLDELSLTASDFQSKADLHRWLKEQTTKSISPV